MFSPPQCGGGTLHRAEELGVVEVDVVVGDPGPQWALSRAEFGQCGWVHAVHSSGDALWIGVKSRNLPRRANSREATKLRSVVVPGKQLARRPPVSRGSVRSHHQALGAHAVAVARGHDERTVTAATDPGLSVAAMLGADLGGVRAWVNEVLGDLVTDSEADGRLRETLRVFLGCGSSYKVAAEELNLHFNSVKYRVGREVARRGRAIDGDRLDVELALLVCHWYGAGVLQQVPAVSERRDL